jgi:Peptidase inhibitor family I36
VAERLRLPAASSFKPLEVSVTRFARIIGTHSRVSLFALLLVIGAALVGTLSIGTSSALAAGKADCNSKNFCLWHDSNFTGTLWFYNVGNYGTNTWRYVGDAAVNEASALYNNRFNVTLIGDDLRVPPSQTDCIGVGGYRGVLSNYTWPGLPQLTENDSIVEFNLHDPDTSC